MDISSEVFFKYRDRHKEKTRESVKILAACGGIKEILKSTMNYEACELCTNTFCLQFIWSILVWYQQI